jgi:hypothetical protein
MSKTVTIVTIACAMAIAVSLLEFYKEYREFMQSIDRSMGSDAVPPPDINLQGSDYRDNSIFLPPELRRLDELPLEVPQGVIPDLYSGTSPHPPTSPAPGK